MRLGSRKLSGFFHKAGTNTTGADLHPFYRAGFFVNTAQALQIRAPDDFCFLIGVADIIADRRFFSTYFTNTRHN